MTFTQLISHFARYIHKVNDVDVTQNCGLAEGTNSATLQTTAAIVYNIYNQQVTKAITDNIAMTACTQQAVSTFCYYLVSANQAGSVTVTKGTNNTYALPASPSGSVPIGAFKVTTDGVTTFTSGTTDLSASGLTVVFYDIDCGIASMLINQAMRRMERKYDFRKMKVRVSITLTPSTATFTNPVTDYKRITHIFATYNYVNYFPKWKDDGLIASAYDTLTTGAPEFIGECGAVESVLSPDVAPTLQWAVAPIPDVAYILTVRAYQYTPFLDNVIYTTNWWTEDAWDVLLYESLIEAEPYLLRDERIKTWREMSGLADMVKSEKAQQFGPSGYPYLGSIDGDD